MKWKCRKEDGFTLLEVMTSMFIMSFSMLILLHLAMIAVDGNTWASGTTSSTQLLQEKLEDLRSQANPASGADTVNDIIRNWTVSTVATHLRQVTLSATWYSPDSVGQTYTINSYIKTDLP
ncbi:MAG: type II secretion system protein [candidate division Zixibacteria bacterium]|nr:type II secretion system protein [candidate division Zixibacteria bacterium]